MSDCRSFASLDGVFCLFEGRLDNLVSLRQDYGIAKTNGSEVSLIIHAYMALRDRGPIPPNRVVAELDGHFAFVLFDTKNQSVFVAHVRDFLFLLFFVLFCIVCFGTLQIIYALYIYIYITSSFLYSFSFCRILKVWQSLGFGAPHQMVPLSSLILLTFLSMVVENHLLHSLQVCF